MNAIHRVSDRKTRSIREVKTVSTGLPTQDGAGVRLTRLIGTDTLNILDPFLMLDVIESDENADYIGGFPSHPHRGFETVTYLMHGKIRHKDNAGHEGVIESGGVQWMTAGRGIIHSEMPEQEDGLLHGFQLWVNLPAKEKMSAPAYQEFTAQQIPKEMESAGIETRVISGATDAGTLGPVKNDFVHPRLFDVRLQQNSQFEQSVDESDNVFIYLMEGQLRIGNQGQRLEKQSLAVLGAGDTVHIEADEDARFLFASAQPLNEPIARGGPFVMNSKEQVLQAFEDFQINQF